MTGLSGVDLLVLVLIGQGATHGYRIEQTIRYSHARSWVRIGASSVYQSLERIAKRGLVETALDTTILPAKRTYKPTAEGLRLLREKALEYLSMGESIFLDVNLGLAAYPFLEPGDVLESLKKRREQLRALLDEAEGFDAPEGGNAPVHQGWIRGHAAHMMKAEIEWTDGLIGELSVKG